MSCFPYPIMEREIDILEEEIFEQEKYTFDEDEINEYDLYTDENDELETIICIEDVLELIGICYVRIPTIKTRGNE